MVRISESRFRRLATFPLWLDVLFLLCTLMICLSAHPRHPRMAGSRHVPATVQKYR